MLNLIKLFFAKYADYFGFFLTGFLILGGGVFLYYQMSVNERLQDELKNKELEITQLSDFIKSQQLAFNELEANLSEKENLSCEIEAKKTQIIKKEGGENASNKAINDSVSFIYSRLREQEERTK